MQKSLTFFSFGGGVQSCGIAALIIKGELPAPDLVLFADTGAEMPNTYTAVSKVFDALSGAGISCEIVKAEGSILDDPINGRGGIATPPWFIKGKKSDIGMLKRSCTHEYKIRPLQKRMKEAAGVAPRQRVKAPQTLWLGISVDELRRAKQPNEKWLTNKFPLIELGLNRIDAALKCYEVFGFVPEKSSCWFCPYTRAATWNTRRTENPEIFAMAVELDKRLGQLQGQNKLEGRPYVHPSAMPLEDATHNQQTLFTECSGYCWV